jgi:drug/metabolite transporter (DMT)-like permease
MPRLGPAIHIFTCYTNGTAVGLRPAMTVGPAKSGDTVVTNVRAPSDVLRGILLMCAGVSSFPFMNAGVKLLADDYPASQITWARFTGHLLIMLVVFLPKYRWTLLRTRHPVIQVGRSAAMLLSNLLFVMAIGQVPLATASAIGFTSPLIVTALSVPLLHESVGWRRWSAVVVGFVGALMVIRPGSGFRDPAVLLILLSSLIYALYQIGTRSVAHHDNAATGIIFAALLGSLGMTLIMPFVFVMPRTLFDAFLFCSLGLLGGFGHYLIIRAFQLGPAAVIAPLGYVELVGSVVLGYLLFTNFPDLWTWLGSGVIIASGIYIALRERKRREARQ